MDNLTTFLVISILIWMLVDSLILKGPDRSSPFPWLKKPSKTLHEYSISIARPSFLSKRLSSNFLITFYISALRRRVLEKIKRDMGEQFQESISSAILPIGTLLTLKLVSPEFDFTDSITVSIDSSFISTRFLGKPKEDSLPGIHNVLFSIVDAGTGEEYHSEIISVVVKDYIFDHVSRPLLSRVSALVLGVGSLAMFILTFLAQIDKTIGLTSGTAAGVFAVALYASFYNLYQRVRPNTP